MHRVAVLMCQQYSWVGNDGVVQLNKRDLKAMFRCVIATAKSNSQARFRCQTAKEWFASAHNLPIVPICLCIQRIRGIALYALHKFTTYFLTTTGWKMDKANEAYLNIHDKWHMKTNHKTCYTVTRQIDDNSPDTLHVVLPVRAHVAELHYRLSIAVNARLQYSLFNLVDEVFG